MAPEEMSAHLVTHRFRAKKNGWPLIQIGPGILTINDTTKFKWPDFKKRVLKALKVLESSYPEPDKMKIVSSELRYINAVEVNSLNENALEFFKAKLGIELSFPKEFFSDKDVSPKPSGLRMEVSFPSKTPKGLNKLRLTLGQKQKMPALIWEHVIWSGLNEVPNGLLKFEDWINAANKLCHSWFFTLIEGDLKRKFQ